MTDVGGDDRDLAGSGQRAPRGSGNAKPVAYLDTGVLVALALGTADMHYDCAVRACIEAVRDGYQLATSPLAVMEMIGVVRRRITMSHKCRPGNSGDYQAADADARRAVSHALALVNNMKAEGLLTIVGKVGWSPDTVLVQRKLLEYPGRTVSGEHSRTCRHRGIGPYDWFHFELAEDAGASVIYTTDAALADVTGSDSEFGHIQVRLVGGPPPDPPPAAPSDTAPA